MSNTHLTEIVNSSDGWTYADCSCGWTSGPLPGMSEAADAIVDHGRETGAEADHA